MGDLIVRSMLTHSIQDQLPRAVRVTGGSSRGGEKHLGGKLCRTDSHRKAVVPGKGEEASQAMFKFKTASPFVKQGRAWTADMCGLYSALDILSATASTR